MSVFPIKYIDKAAFYTSFRAKLEKIEGRNPDNIFYINVPRWLEFYEHHIGLVQYRRFINQRKRLKRLARRQAGVPERYSTYSTKSGFKLKDIAKITYRRTS